MNFAVSNRAMESLLVSNLVYPYRVRKNRLSERVAALERI